MDNKKSADICQRTFLYDWHIFCLLTQELSQHFLLHSGQFLTKSGCSHHSIVANVLLHELTSFSRKLCSFLEHDHNIPVDCE